MSDQSSYGYVYDAAGNLIKKGNRYIIRNEDQGARKAGIKTDNLEFSKWNGIFYDQKLTSAIIDRIIHHCHLLIFNGPSWRLEHSTINSQ